MTFHRDAELARLSLGDAGDIPLALKENLCHLVSAPEESLAGGAETERDTLALEEKHLEMLFDRLDLVRERGLREMETAGRLGKISRLGKGDESLEVADIEHGVIISYIDDDPKDYLDCE